MLPPGAGRLIAGGALHATLNVAGGPGSILFVPAGIPHAFANLSSKPARMFFQAAPEGHEDYFEELAALLRASKGKPDPQAVAELRSRHDIHQLTRLRT